MDTCEKDTPLLPAVSKALTQAANFTFHHTRQDGHWYGELVANPSLTAEYITLLYALQLPVAEPNRWISWLLSEQKPDGSWGLVPEMQGDVSMTVESYLALKVLGLSPNEPCLLTARDFILSVGGVAKVRIFTRFYLAIFGLFPWNALPELPPELILVPTSAPVSIYYMASWARDTVIPLLLISYHRPIFRLPNGRSESNDYLDELWCMPAAKVVAYSPGLWDLWKTDLTGLFFAGADKILHGIGGLMRSYSPIRSYARRKCVSWALEHQEEEGGWGGIFPPMYGGVLALFLEGFPLCSDPVRRGLEATEGFLWSDGVGKRMQGCISPMWDTILMSIGLLDAGLPGDHPSVQKSRIKARQQLGPHGDWRVLRPHIRAGRFSFEYFHVWKPDTNDTAAAVLAMVKQDPTSMGSTPVLYALQWILGMQNPDAGWGAFDYTNDKLFFNKIPFSDMEAMCDPSTADVTGRILEAFGLLLQAKGKHTVPGELQGAMIVSSTRALHYLSSEQEPTGAWYGRWGVNYIYGTSNVLCGLAYFNTKERIYNGVQEQIQSGLHWLVSTQNPDGGWGETVETYRHPNLAGHGLSTASQTSWALMGLLAHLPPTDPAIRRGIQYLLQNQASKEGCPGESWHETAFTGTGFPNYYYMRYSFYSHYFPIMALGRYARLMECKVSKDVDLDKI
ncbi:hypothetical protein ASPWEDRAFT_740365 [Aspergillus wentii DTO 134E9]|uniref:Terpene cyclase/mutase family member n=1 Tax=Aspergillus wentii DTO 134E9 TaxID=1073089 RepID=A0A1L9RKS7_ASPWE|nr:uncharacterized protein ASPWEDRAFT_740365 [Aspergillus wentii DTO 134E9]OJJ35539.1 hypothetical protein ASPWEDRAFT_740365 [Aspergillus wentii DTO 134E9]